MSNYSVIGTVNMGLGRIGQSKIDSLTELSQAAIQANLVWPMVRDEVLEAADWDFATVRKALARNVTDPVQGFTYAYTLPADFLRLGEDRKDDHPVYPHGYNYVVETLEDGTKCLFIDYDNSSEDLYVRYIRREENPARWTAHFVSTVSFRLGAELAMILTESLKKYDTMMGLYEKAVKAAKAISRSGNRLEDETGSTAWDLAGR